MNEKFAEKIAQLESIKAEPPNHCPANRLTEFRGYIDLAIGVYREADTRLVAAGAFMADFTNRVIAAVADEDAAAYVLKARQCCVFEKRSPRGPQEMAMALIDTPSDQPHNRERSYPVRQR